MSRNGGEEGFNLPDKKPTAHKESTFTVSGSYLVRFLPGILHFFPWYVATARPLSKTASVPVVANGRSGAMRHAIVTKDFAVTLVTSFCGSESIVTGAGSTSANGASMTVFL
jgi:hypothetical protein